MEVTYDVSYNSLGCHVTFNETTECPICKHFLKPTVLHKVILTDNNNKWNLYITYLCNHCFKPFLSHYTDLEKIQDKQYSYKANKLVSIEPNLFEEKTFDDCICSLSPDFVKIYNQAYAAEHFNLDEIAGIGYRKALEFLIKDFLIIHESKEPEKVKSTALGVCINTMIDNPQLKTAASRATWLGNDQTHYEQKYQDKDISDLKRLINLSVHWITMIYLTDEAEAIEKK